LGAGCGRGPNSAIVGSANGALESLARSLALELAPVRVNAVTGRDRHADPRCHAGRSAARDAGVERAISNSGLVDLVFVVITLAGHG
jgi:NAD(P)-dependent dehydrogenase (short-subunit alcohol dehydrogenase family)